MLREKELLLFYVCGMCTVLDMSISHTCRPCVARERQHAASLFLGDNHSPMDAQRRLDCWYLRLACTCATRGSPVPPRKAWQARLVSISEIWSGSSGRADLNPLSNRGLGRSWPWERRQIAQSCAGDSQRDRSFDGLPANLIRSPSRKKNNPWKYPRLSHSVPSHPHTPIISHPIC